MRTPADITPEIIYAWPYLEWGGVQTYFLGLARAGRGRFRIRVVCPAGTSSTITNFFSAAGAIIDPIPARIDVARPRSLADRGRGRLRLWRANVAYARALAARGGARPVWHVDLPPWQFYPAISHLLKRGHVVVTLHTALPAIGGWRHQAWRAKFSRLAAHPRFHLIATNRDVVRSLAPFVPEARLREVPIAPSAFDRAEIDGAAGATRARDRRFDALDLPRERAYVVTAAQFIERKGCWTLLEATRRLIEQGLDVGLLWLSPSPPEAATQARIDRVGLGDRFRCLTAADFGSSRHDLLSLVRCADIFALASVEEGLPLAMIEAMALGLPVVATRVNAVPEAIDDGVHGVLVPPGDAAALTAGLAGLLRDPARAAALGARARDRAFAEFTQEAAARPTFAVYASASR